MTKSDVLERLKLAANLIKQANKVLREIENNIDDKAKDTEYDTYCDYINDLRDGEDPETVFDTLDSDGFLKNMEEGETEPYPRIKVNAQYPRGIDVNIPLDGGKNYLTTFTGEADYGTYQAGVVYSDKDEIVIHDLTLVERQRGELAEINGLDPDTNDKLHILIYDNPEEEDYTKKILFDPDEIPSE